MIQSLFYRYLSPRYHHPLVELSASFVVYSVFCWLGLLLARPELFSVSPIWPASGVGLAILVLRGPAHIVSIFLGGWVTIFAFAPSSDSQFLYSLSNAFVAALQSFIGYGLWKRWMPQEFPLDRPVDVARYLAFLAPLISLVGPLWSSIAIPFIVDGAIDFSSSIFFAWWIGDLTGYWLMLPFALAWFSSEEPAVPKKASLFLCLLGFALVCVASFGDFSHAVNTHRALGFLPFPFLAWLSIQFGKRGASGANILLAITTIWGTATHPTAFVFFPDEGPSLLIQLYFGAAISAGMILAAISAQKERAMQGLADTKKRLEKEVLALQKIRKELRTANKKARQAAQVKNQFLANISHEIRTPLGAILGFGEILLNDENCVGSNRKNVKTIFQNAKHLLNLVNDILDLSAVETKELEILRQKIDVKSIIEEATNLFEPVIAAKGLSFEIHIDKNTPAEIHTDPVRLKQILVNLLSNAVKYTDSGFIQVESCRGRSGALLVLVSDSGCGIPADSQERLFKPFTQLQQSASRRFGGTGLGLALSRELAKALGGDVELIRSRPKQGSTFRLSLPDQVTNKSSAAVEPKPTSIKADSLSGKKILLVDDNEDNQVLIRHHLSQAGAKVSVASDGFEGIRQAQAEHFDLVLMDLQMPKLDGYETTRRLRRQGYTVPVLALTAHAMVRDARRSIEAGCSGHLSKPITGPSLVEAVSKYTAN